MTQDPAVVVWSSLQKGYTDRVRNFTFAWTSTKLIINTIMEAPQSRQELEANLEEYKQQLQQVEQLLLIEDTTNEEYQEMYNSLTEVIQLTEELLREAIESEKAAGGPSTSSVDIRQQHQAACQQQQQPQEPGNAAAAAGSSAAPASNLMSILPASVAEQIRKAQLRAALQGKAPASWAVGHAVHAIYPADGQYYDAKVQGVTEDGKLRVAYDGYEGLEELPLSSIREKPDAPEIYTGVAAPKRKRVEEAPTITELPKWLEIKEGDDPKTIERKKKLIKSHKSKIRFQNMDLATKQKQDNWKSFISGSAKKKKTGYFTGTRKESIFAVPEGINAKVGVTGSGKGMTQYQKNKRLTAAGEEGDA